MPGMIDFGSRTRRSANAICMAFWKRFPLPSGSSGTRRRVVPHSTVRAFILSERNLMTLFHPIPSLAHGGTLTLRGHFSRHYLHLRPIFVSSFLSLSQLSNHNSLQCGLIQVDHESLIQIVLLLLVVRSASNL